MKSKNTVGCFIMCRMGSARLPGKALLSVQGKPVIEHIITRAKTTTTPKVFVLCTSTDPSDDVLESIANANGIQVFRGSRDDVLARLLGAARRFNVTHFINYTADNIFCDPGLMDAGIKQMIRDGLDFVYPPEDLVVGGAAYSIATQALERVCAEKNNDRTEYYPQYFTENPKFRVASLNVSDALFRNTSVRATIDYLEDLEFARKVFEELRTDYNTVPLKKIIQLVHERPEIARINLFRHRDWVARQKIQKKKTGPQRSRNTTG